MKAVLQRIGNSQGIIIPKPILAQVGFEREVQIDVEDDTAAAGDDALAWPEVSNEADAELTW